MTLKTAAASAYTALAIVVLSGSISVANAQGPSSGGSATNGGHSKPTGIPEKKPDGTWESLKPAQQKILAPLESDWDYMLPESRKKWVQVANLYPKMNEQKDRRVARENYLSSLKFPAEKKAEAWSAYQKLSDEEKKKLAKAEENKKKPTAANAPTLQQHPIKQKPALTLSAPESPAESTESTSTPSNQ